MNAPLSYVLHILSILCITQKSLKNVKCTLVQALRLCTGRTAHRERRGIALPFHDHGTRRGWGVSVTPRLLFTPGKEPVPIVQEAGWAPGPVWTGMENLAPQPGFDLWTVQPVASRYTDYANRPRQKSLLVKYLFTSNSELKFLLTLLVRENLFSVRNVRKSNFLESETLEVY
jgi:hypothetical protein